MDETSGWTLFTIRKVSVKLHVSLLFLILYVVLVAMAQFSVVARMSGVRVEELSVSPIVWAFLFAVALIISIFVHEFGHVLVAQAHGYEAHSITLMMLGGVSQLEKMPEKPWDEFKVAIIGPLVSLAIGGLLLALRGATTSANIDFFCYWVGETNIVLGVFNLLPAFPTDGGRVLRSIFASQMGALRGTRAAVGISHVFAWLLGLFGLLQLNILLMLLAVFIYAAAKSELFTLTARMVLKGMKARDVMDVSVPAVQEDSFVSEAVMLMTRSRRLLLPVQGKNESYGFIAASEISRIPKEARDGIPVASLQRPALKVVSPDQDLSEVMLKVMPSRIGAIPVVQDHLLIGMIRTADILELMQLRQLEWEEPSTESWSMPVRHVPSR